MKAVILAGGLGTRFSEETSIRPKPMIEIGGRPILWHIMKHYARYGLTEFILCLGYRGVVIKEYFANYQLRWNDVTLRLGRHPAAEYHTDHGEEGWEVTLADTGDEAMTGARVKRIRKYLPPGPFCLTYADGLSDIDLRRLIAFHRAHEKLGTVTGVRPSGRFGELHLDGDRVTSFMEKPVVEGFINGGFFVLEREFVDRYIDDGDDIVLEQEPLRRLAAEGQLKMYHHEGFWQMMDTYREWKLLEDLWNRGKAPWNQ